MNKLHAVAAALVALGTPAAFAASEGGDTWSAVAPASYSGSKPLIVVATTAGLGELRAPATSGLGRPVYTDEPERIVPLGASTRWVNVAYGERVTFTAADERGALRSFAWRFDVSPVRTHVDLDQVAPSDFPAHGVRVFVEPQYRGG